MMILKMMTASWNLHWQMKIHLYYRGPAWAAEALQMLRNPLGSIAVPVFAVWLNLTNTRRGALSNVYCFHLLPQS